MRQNVMLTAVPGETVVLDGNIPATVVAVELTGDAPHLTDRYKVAWWNDRTRIEQWVAAAEIKPL